MNPMSKKLCNGAAVLCCLVSSTNLSAHSNTSSQSLSITIPKVALVELDQAQHTFTFSVDQDSVSHSSTVAISSNDRRARLNVNVAGLPQGFQLAVSANSAICADALAEIDTHRYSCQVGMARTKSGLLTLTGSRESAQALPNGAYQANITYTLSD